MFHVFTDGRDAYFEKYADALAQFKAWREEFGNVRLYELDEDEDEQDCLKAIGAYPA